MERADNEIKRVTLNLPKSLLAEAQACSGKNMTATIVEGLEYLKRAHAYELAMKLKGKLNLDIDLEISRERRC